MKRKIKAVTDYINKTPWLGNTLIGILGIWLGAMFALAI